MQSQFAIFGIISCSTSGNLEHTSTRTATLHATGCGYKRTGMKTATSHKWFNILLRNIPHGYSIDLPALTIHIVKGRRPHSPHYLHPRSVLFCCLHLPPAIYLKTHSSFSRPLFQVLMIALFSVALLAMQPMLSSFLISIVSKSVRQFHVLFSWSS